MAAFRHPAQALRAVRAAQTTMTAGEPRLWLKVGIHQGPCIVVNLNERLDYFGSTVNIAARLPGFSTGGEIILSEAVRCDPEVDALLEQVAQPNSMRRFHAEVKGVEELVPLWRMRM
jgi:class 3 adenylate cyclase